MAKASAAVAATATASTAIGGTVQITLLGNEVTHSPLDVSNLDGDVTGDGVEDMTDLTPSTDGNGTISMFGMGSSWFKQLRLRSGGDTLATARSGSGFGGDPYFPLAMAYGDSHTVSGNPLAVSGYYPISFTDVDINGGATTSAFVEVRAVVAGRSDLAIKLVRVIFDDVRTGTPVTPNLQDTFLEWSVLNEMLAQEAAATAASNAALKSSLTKKAKKLKKKAKAAKKKGQAAKAKKLAKKAKKLQQQANQL